MHAIRIELLQRQANCVGLPLEIIEIPYPCSNRDYATIMQRFVDNALTKNIECFAFGDLFLEDIRTYRIEKLQGTGISPVFPLWHQATDELAREMIDGGLKAVISCLDPKRLSKNFVGREFNHAFLNTLPDSVDPCGENGEFHSFVFDAPIFQEKIAIRKGEICEHDDLIFVDILPEPRIINCTD
jgi:uncharacterized protein (TIGR00290 family)